MCRYTPSLYLRLFRRAGSLNASYNSSTKILFIPLLTKLMQKLYDGQKKELYCLSNFNPNYNVLARFDWVKLELLTY